MKNTIVAIVAAAILTACAHNPQVTANYDVIPLPDVIELDTTTAGNRYFVLTHSTDIVAADTILDNEAEFLKGYIEKLTGLKLKTVAKMPSRNYISLAINPDIQGDEAYRITVDRRGIRIEGATPAGVFYGVQTLRKSIPDKDTRNVAFPLATVEATPRFAYRGAHLDVSRHFFPADSVKKYIDMMALHGMNTFHWHLTDDQGWRIEIEKYPQLTTVGATRPGTTIGRNTMEYDTVEVSGYYTKEEARDIVDYAARRHITVIPEIDLPGHMQAALAAYPALGCTGGPYEVWKNFGVSKDVLCAGNDSVYTFLEDVLSEITDIFPSEFIHIGGDECPKAAWEKCPKCQAKIRELGLKADGQHTAEQKLQSHVTRYVEDFLATKGRRIIGWDEILEGGIAPDATLMSWRNVNHGFNAAAMGHDVIMSPKQYCYLDYYQSPDRDRQPLAFGREITIDKLYSYEPLPDSLTVEQKQHIKGVQANLWTEYVPEYSHVEYMALPRWAALAEVQWMQPQNRDFENFFHRLRRLLNVYRNEGYNYCPIIFEEVDSIADEAGDSPL